MAAESEAIVSLNTGGGAILDKLIGNGIDREYAGGVRAVVISERDQVGSGGKEEC
ncbi:hypothetical protein C368_04104 [Cryptococcus neoformans 125.91]|nr:hypothetical protein C368_04104 [Cryptococcus neoformans var. grubii 125.91]